MKPWLPLIVLTTTGCLQPLRPLENAIVFQPLAPDAPPGLAPPPNCEDVWIAPPQAIKPTRRLHGWYLVHPQPRGVILYCHGNGGHLGHCRETLELLRDQLQCNVLAFDYSGYGRSSGSPSEQNCYRDAALARQWVANRNNIPEGDVILFGYSLGGAVAVDLARTRPPRALILDRTFSTLPDAAAKLVPWLPGVGSLVVNEFDSLAKIKHYRGLLLQIHGDADEVVPIELGRKLFVGANEPKTFVTVPMGRHNAPLGPVAITAMKEFLNTLPK